MYTFFFKNILMLPHVNVTKVWYGVASSCFNHILVRAFARWDQGIVEM